MENTISNNIQPQLDELNTISEGLIRETYQSYHCTSVWILGLDDGMS